MRTVITVVVPLILFMAACKGDDYAERMEREHAGEIPTPTPATEGLQGTAVGRAVVYSAGDGRTATGYLALPGDGSRGIPGLIVIHEWWGLNDNIRAMTDKLAEEGYAALAVDLYGGSVAENSEQASGLSRKASSDMNAARANLEGAYAYLADSLGAIKVGSIGWCFGGGMSLQAALAMPDRLKATVIYYGRLTDDPEQLAPLQMPILGQFGAEDRGITPSSVHAFEKTLTDLGKDVEVYIYENAGHAFANPSGQRYRKEAADMAWRRTTAFLDRTLKD